MELNEQEGEIHAEDGLEKEIDSDDMIELLEDIRAQESMIRALPRPSSRTDWQDRVKQLKVLGGKKERYELLHEEERIASVVSEFKELHPPKLFENDCPICLEQIQLTRKESLMLMSCCGGAICKVCLDSLVAGGAELSRKVLETCPLCRGGFPDTDQKRADGMKALAKKGHAIAQLNLGCYYGAGNMGIKQNQKLALKWFRAASEKGIPEATFSLALMHKEGLCGLDKSDSTVRGLFKQAAEAGHMGAQEQSAHACWWGIGGEKDMKLAVRYATLACSDGPQDASDNFSHAACLLGWLHQFGEGGLDENLYLAKHYLQLSAEGGHYRAYACLARALMELGRMEYGNTYIPGHSPVPEALYWARKSIEGAIANGEARLEPMAREFVLDLEKKVQSHCSNCNKKANALPKDEKLKCCAKCRAAWYCSKECQAKHWHAGHKTDCIRPKKK